MTISSIDIRSPVAEAWGQNDGITVVTLEEFVRFGPMIATNATITMAPLPTLPYAGTGAVCAARRDGGGPDWRR